MIREPLIFEISDEGKRAYALPKLDIPEKKDVLQDVRTRKDVEGFPQVSEIEIVRHFTRLSQTNFCIDIGFYPLGSCTMKYNPKINEKIASFPGFSHSHPFSPEDLVQGNLEILKTTEELLNEITGMDAFTLQPSAGAQGELVGMMLIRAYLEEKGDPRKIVLIPDSAHGTNPSSAHLSGYRVQEIKSNEQGTVDVEDLVRAMNDDVAALMITNPNTLGIFESDIKKICAIVHEKGGFVYMDGANMNALLGECRPGDMEVGVTKVLEPYLPIPVIERRKDSSLYFNLDRPKSIGRVQSFYGNFLVVVKALAYILSLGPNGLREVAETP
jgi:glycine dehydrogenase subunit 2